MTRLAETTCEFCKFYDATPAHASGMGTCHRYAPRGPVVSAEGQNIMLFPLMAPNAFCGEFERKLILNS